MKKPLILLAPSLLLLSQLAVAAPSDAIVGTWTWSSEGDVGAITFLKDGRYFLGEAYARDSAHTGIEWGTYSWNATTGAITATAAGDTNGNWGLAGDVDGTQYMQVNGNVATVSQVGCSDCGGNLSRALPGTSPIVGSWFASNSEMTHVVTFTGTGEYVDLSIYKNDSAHTGIEYGTYSWNSSNGAITANTQIDANGNWGFQVDPNGTQYMSVSGNRGLITQPGCDDCTVPLARILPVPEPETYAMLLAGLGILGGVARRRRG